MCLRTDSSRRWWTGGVTNFLGHDDNAYGPIGFWTSGADVPRMMAPTLTSLLLSGTNEVERPCDFF